MLIVWQLLILTHCLFLMMKNYRSVSVSVTRDSEGRYHLRVIGRQGEVITATLGEAMAAAYGDRR